jgi:hypothetical protein
MQPPIKLNLLLQNAKLNNYTHIPFKSKFITQIFGEHIRLPENTSSYSFIFSCFALSIDGKLCYPDTLSGLDIALSNKLASPMEKYADWLCLLLARTISDAVIFSSNIFKKSSKRKKPSLAVTELQKNQNKKSKTTLLIFCRDLNTIDFTHDMLKDMMQPVVIFYTGGDLPSLHSWSTYKLSEFKLDNKQIKYLVYLDMEFSYVFSKLYSFGYKIILNESPYFHHKLLEEELLAEIWLNYSCSYIGGNNSSLGQNQIQFNSQNHPDTEILALYNIDYHFLYSRQLVHYPKK